GPTSDALHKGLSFWSTATGQRIRNNLQSERRNRMHTPIDVSIRETGGFVSQLVKL
ncbi:hypothetical protein NPIL_210001, partial [Nephila pilipes]